MSELKPFNSERIYWAVEQVERKAGDIDGLHLDDNLFYLKSETDKVITHQKYKRCLAMAKLCNEKWLVHDFAEIPTKLGFYDKWHYRWLGLAEKLKEVK